MAYSHPSDLPFDQHGHLIDFPGDSHQDQCAHQGFLTPPTPFTYNLEGKVTVKFCIYVATVVSVIQCMNSDALSYINQFQALHSH